MIVLLPCYSLEDFSLYRSSEESDEIFSAWSALYHPALIEKFGKAPRWEPAGNPTSGVERSLVLIPPCCEATVPSEWLKKIEASAAVVIRNKSTRTEMIAEAADRLNLDLDFFDADVVDSFLSLGFCHLLTELLTRKLRYMSNLDAQNFQNRLLDGVRAIRSGDSVAVEDELQKAFDLLCQSKEYFFPTAVKLLDLTSVEEDDFAENLPNALLRRRTRRETTNLILPEPFLETLRTGYPRTLDLLRQEIAAQRVFLVGSDLDESPLYLFSATETAEKILQGRRRYFDLLGVAPNVFGRRSAGYSPILAQILKKCGYSGALAWTQDGWSLDGERQSLIRWRSPNGSLFPTLAKKPIDAELGENFLLLPDTLGNTYYSDDVISAVFAHRPDRESIWLGDVLRMNRFAPVLGQVYSIDDYFDVVGKAGFKKEFEKDDFRTNFLTRASKSNLPDSVSRWIDDARTRSIRQAENGIEIVGSLFFRKEKSKSFDGIKADFADRLKEEFQRKLENETPSRSGSTAVSPQENADFETGFLIVNPSPNEQSVVLDSRYGTIASENGELITVSACVDSSDSVRLLSLPGLSRVWIPQNSSRDVSDSTQNLSDSETPDSLKTSKLSSTIFRNVSKNGRNETSVANSNNRGFWRKLTANWFPESAKSPAEPAMVDYCEERFSKTAIDRFYRLRNDFFEIRIDPTSGEWRRLTTYADSTNRGEILTNGILRRPERGNRFAFQLGLKLAEKERRQDRRSKDDANFGYSIMAADKIDVLSTGPIFGRIRVAGRLISPVGETLSQFVQILTVRRASRIVDVSLSFDPIELPSEHYWDNYFGCRFAWKDSAADVLVGGHHSFWTTTRDYLQAPQCVDIRSDENYGITILSGSSPFYRRFGLHRLDSVLIPANESRRNFQFGIGIDLQRPARTAAYWGNVDSTLVLSNIPRPKRTFEQFVSFDSPDVCPLSIEPIFNDDDRFEKRNDGGSKKKSTAFVGLKIVLQETSNSPTELTVKTSLPLAKVANVDFNDVELAEIPLDRSQEFRLSLKKKDVVIVDLYFK